MKHEKFNHDEERFSINDYEGYPYFDLIKKLPPELARFHIKHIDDEMMTDEEAINYMSDIVSARKEAVNVSEISDNNLKKLLEGSEQELFRALETTVFNNPDNYLGEGTTARVKLYQIETNDPENSKAISMAVKYILTPNNKTLSAKQEHDVVREMDRMKKIEEEETKFPRRSKYIRVPHPFLHHSTENIQLFAMEQVDGITLDQASREGMLHTDMRESLRNSQLKDTPIDEMEGYIERFFKTMHEHYIHGDIKPKNLMISRDGVLYVIDFGQARSCNSFNDKQQNSLENLKDDEISQTKFMMRSLMNKVFGNQ